MTPPKSRTTTAPSSTKRTRSTETATTRQPALSPRAISSLESRLHAEPFHPTPLEAEWLEADGLGGFASGTVSGVRTRRYHALLLAATTPPTGRFVLVNGMEVRVTTPTGAYDLTSQRYSADVVHPDGLKRIESFALDPWPRWVYRLEDGTRIEQEIFARHGMPGIVVLWRVLGSGGEGGGVSLSCRLLLSCRDTHALHHENDSFRFNAMVRDEQTIWQPYDGAPSFGVATNGRYVHHPLWYHHFYYEEEFARGLDHVEDLASPGAFRFDLSRGEGALILTAGTPAAMALGSDGIPAGVPAFLYGFGTASALETARALRNAELAHRGQFATRLERAADAYLVQRGVGRTIVAGYPWFTDWGRDTFIAMRGLCLATGRLEDARQILLEWAGLVSEGMLPDRFVERGDEPEYHSVDTSLWYIIAVKEFLNAATRAHMRVLVAEKRALESAVLAILHGYARGTVHGIHADEDGLLASGEPGAPRTGKAVEIQALWLNSLHIGSEFAPEWRDLYAKARESFAARFWNEDVDGLYDVADVDGEPGHIDPSFRPNQIFAVGGLPLTVLDDDKARRLVESVERRLLTPIGLRSLAPDEPGYAPRYEGGVRERDGVYHQGTVWPWLIGPFVEAWVRVRGSTPEAKAEARERFLEPLLRHLDTAGLGHISEIADGDPVHTPRGCPFQAWSLAEVIRLDRMVLAE